MDMLACKNTSLAHVGCFGDKAAQDQAAKTQGGNTPRKASTTKPPISSTPRTPVGTPTQKTVNTASASAQPPTNLKAEHKKGTAKDENNKEIMSNPTDPEKKLKICP
jgi:hypothetical protein